MFEWTKSVRAISAVLMVLAIIFGLFFDKIEPNQFMQVAMLIVGAYFAKRDTPKDRGK